MNQTGLSVLGLLLFGTVAVVGHLWASSELSEQDIRAAERLPSYLSYLNAMIESSLSDQKVASPEEVVLEAKKLLLRGGVGYWSGLRSGTKLFVKLRDVVDQCDYAAYLVLAKNYVAHQSAGKYYHDTKLTRQVVDHYRDRHNQNCRQAFKEELVWREKQVDPVALRRVKATFATVRIANFTSFEIDPDMDMYERKRFITLPLDFLSGRSVVEADRLIAGQIIKQAQDDGVSAKNSMSNPMSIIKDYLFKPCAEFRRKLGSSLDAAKFDAMLDDFKGYLADSETFYRALVENRLCKFALEQRDKLEDILSDILSEN